MIIRNVKRYGEDLCFTEGEIVVQNGIFVENDEADEEIIDGEGCYAIPGLIDLHFHGCMGYDFCDGTKETIAKIAEYEASVGVTAIAPATLTLSVEELEHILSVAAEYKKEARQDSARFADLVGINMEGPFISREKKGAQNEKFIIPCDVKICQKFLTSSEGLVKIVGIAPEQNESALDFVQEMKEKVHISLAHTISDYDKAMEAFTAGADHAVHLYNAMPAFTHRAPGVVGAVLDSPHVSAELICDGVHVHPSAVRAAFRMLGAERIIFISDSLRATGMPDGRYMLGGLDIEVHGNRATLVSGGALAGSVTTLMDCMRIAVKEMGIPLEAAVACATRNPAKKLGIYDQYGSIAPGKKGNLVLLDEDLNVKMVIKDGVQLKF